MFFLLLWYFVPSLAFFFATAVVQGGMAVKDRTARRSAFLGMLGICWGGFVRVIGAWEFMWIGFHRRSIID